MNTPAWVNVFFFFFFRSKSVLAIIRASLSRRLSLDKFKESLALARFTEQLTNKVYGFDFQRGKTF